jgi:hypothetical protein
MIYLKETLNLAPASPETRDDFITFATTDLIPTAESLGVRLVGAWFSHAQKMDTFIAMLNAAKDMFPIIASWRAIAGNPNEVIDLWKGALGQEPYSAADDRSKAFFRPLREIAPRERLVNLYVLPYSPLR